MIYYNVSDLNTGFLAVAPNRSNKCDPFIRAAALLYKSSHLTSTYLVIISKPRRAGPSSWSRRGVVPSRKHQTSSPASRPSNANNTRRHDCIIRVFVGLCLCVCMFMHSWLGMFAMNFCGFHAYEGIWKRLRKQHAFAVESLFALNIGVFGIAEQTKSEAPVNWPPDVHDSLARTCDVDKCLGLDIHASFGCCCDSYHIIFSGAHVLHVLTWFIWFISG